MQSALSVDSFKYNNKIFLNIVVSHLSCLIINIFTTLLKCLLLINFFTFLHIFMFQKLQKISAYLWNNGFMCVHVYGCVCTDTIFRRLFREHGITDSNDSKVFDFYCWGDVSISFCVKSGNFRTQHPIWINYLNKHFTLYLYWFWYIAFARCYALIVLLNLSFLHAFLIAKQN